ncbi:orcokinin peptides-like isoform X3 [Epargyreus clarus]|uniref:orcokinin peptides-like isoform X3 n=1 Tax=Epargyreus clarus TaxID=520877 RepID=UPI003C2B969F
MMRASGAVAVAIAALLVCCSADPHQEQDAIGEHATGDRYDNAGHKARNLDPLGGGNLVREVRESPQFPYLMARQYEYGTMKRDPWAPPIEYTGYYEGFPKRNFDEIDRSNMDTFVKKRNFDEIDQTSMPFPFKRFYHRYGSNYVDTSSSNLDKKRYRPDYPMDEIDLSSFPIGSKRSPTLNLRHL